MASRKAFWNKKRISGILAVMMTLVTLIGVLTRPLEIQAYGIFSGVETVVAEKVSAGESYRILEIVPDGAKGEIGYLCEGYEPYYFQDRLISYLEENKETVANTSENRIAYMNNLIQQLTDTGLCGENGPLMATEYQESYFLDEVSTDDSQIMLFSEDLYETVTLDGNYVVNEEQEGLYTANVVGFSYNTAGDYYVEFESTKPLFDYAPYNQPYEHKAGGYYVPVTNPKAGATYYYISSFSYYGADSASSLYMAELDSEMPYLYVGADGDFDFLPGEISEENPQNQSCSVQIGQIHYKGGITNKNWFATQILCAQAEDNLKIEVQTVTESELASTDISKVDFIYISGDTELGDCQYGLTSSGERVDNKAAIETIRKMVEGKTPCMIDFSLWVNSLGLLGESDIYDLVETLWPSAMMYPDDDNNDQVTELEAVESAANGVNQNVYMINTLTDNGERQPFFQNLTEQMSEEEVAAGFEAVESLIWQENSLRTGDELLDTGISKATAIQFIINYKNERTFSQKESLHVLDIEPAMGDLYLSANKDTTDSRALTKSKVAEWTGIAKENITITRMTSAEFIGKIEDLNTEYDLVYFGLGYNGDYMNRDSSGGTVHNDTMMDGLVYTHTGDAVLRRPILAGLLDTDHVQNKSSNFFYSYEPLATNGNLAYNKTATASSREVDYYDASYAVDGNTGSRWASIAADNQWLTVDLGASYNVSKVKISWENAYASRYQILVSNDNKNWQQVFEVNDARGGNEERNFNSVSARYIKLNCIKRGTGYGFSVYEFEVYGSGNTAGTENPLDAYGFRTEKNEQGKLVTKLKEIKSFSYNNPANSSARQSISVNVGNVGVYRFAGNDITQTKYTDLVEYLGAKYPIVYAEGFYDEAGQINTALLDNSSVLYQFMEACQGQDNVFDVKNGKIEKEGLFHYYINMPKLNLTLFNPNDGTIPEDKALNKGTELTSTNSYGNQVMQIDMNSAAKTGSYTIRMKISVNSSIGNQTRTKYTPKLYFDMNADGKFVSNESYSEIMSDCLILDSKGKEPAKNSDGLYTLTSGEEYILEKQIPSAYRGILTWKLEICQNSNAYIRTSKVGYTVVSKGDNSDQQIVKVLQIKGNNNNWDLSTDGDMKNYISKFAQAEGIKFEIVTTTPAGFQNNMTSFDKLKDYDMLIFGFEDSYTDISNVNHALDALEDFINSGRSVLFTHDLTSFINSPTAKTYAYDLAGNYTVYGLSGSSGYTNAPDGTEAHWGYNINNKLRNILAMDRYGITYSEKTSSEPELAKVRYQFLRQGQVLDLQQVTDANGKVTDTIGTIDTSAEAGGVLPTGLASASLGADKDIAYVAGSGRSQSYGETQGYTYGAINFNYRNNHAISSYAFNKYMPWNIMWVPNSSDGAAMGQIGNMRATQVNDGQITHYPYEIGTEITIADTHYQYYQLDMEEDLDGDSNSDIVVWYCLSSTSNNSKNVYTASPNDVRNNYYIYSIGNVMYSGVGHSTVNNVEEKRLFFNTIVAAYKIGIKNPTVTILSGSERTAEEQKYEYLPYDTTIGEKGLDSEFTFYYLVSEPNLVTSKKTITANYSFGDGEVIPTTDNGDGSVYITTSAVSQETVSQAGNNRITGLNSGNVYKATIHNMNGTKLQQLLTSGSFRIKVHIASSFDYYGDSYGKENGGNPAPAAEASLEFIKTTLFDLD